MTFRHVGTVALLLGALGCGSGAPPSDGSGGSGGADSGGAGASDEGAGTGGTATGGTATGGTSSEGTGGASGGPFRISVHLASEEDPAAPTTVGIVEWSTELGTPTGAVVEFGRTTEYGRIAPVDLSAQDFRTALLGLDPEQTYHFRVTATVDGQEVSSSDQTLTTGAGADTSLIEVVRFDVADADARDPGFILTSEWSTDEPSQVFILGPEGDVVWWYDPRILGGVGKAALSADGRDIWMTSTDFSGGGEALVRVGVDGLGPESYAATGGSHDIIPVEGDVMAYIDYDSSDGLSGVVEINRAGDCTGILAFGDLPGLAAGELEHPNALWYDAGSQMYYLSSKDVDIYRFPRTGGTPDNIVSMSTVLGSNDQWGGQHGIELLPGDHLLLFANGASSDVGSSALEFDLADGSEVWRYDGDAYTANFGDVQRLPGGSTLVTYSNASLLEEVTVNGEVVLEIEIAQRLGYATWLPSLYPM
jgi:hypothetical protein